MSRWLQANYKRKAISYVPYVFVAIFKNNKLIAVDSIFDYNHPDVDIFDDFGETGNDGVLNDVKKIYGEDVDYEIINDLWDKAESDGIQLDKDKINAAIKSGDITGVDYEKFISVST